MMRTGRGLRRRYWELREHADALEHVVGVRAAELADRDERLKAMREYAAAQARQVDALRGALAELGRQLAGARRPPLGDTLPMPCIDLTRPGPEADLLTPWRCEG